MKHKKSFISLLIASIFVASVSFSGCGLIPAEKNVFSGDNSAENSLSSADEDRDDSKDTVSEPSKDEPDETSAEKSDVESSEESSEASKEDEEKLKFESEVEAAQQRWENISREYKVLREYRENNYPESMFRMFDVNNDGHLEMFIGCTLYGDNFGKSKAEYEYHPNLLCSALEDRVITTELECPDAVRGISHTIDVVPEKENGKVIGVNRFMYVTHFADLPWGVGVSFKTITSNELISERGYNVEIKTLDPYIRTYVIADGNETKNVELEEFQRNIKLNYDIIYTEKDDYIQGFRYNADNGDNSLIDVYGDFDDYLLYESDSRLLTYADLEAMLRRKECNDDHSRKLYLELARNEMAAKYGYIFSTGAFKDHFENLDWYKELKQDNYTLFVSQNNENTPLNEIEKANNDIILEYETELGLDDITL